MNIPLTGCSFPEAPKSLLAIVPQRQSPTPAQLAPDADSASSDFRTQPAGASSLGSVSASQVKPAYPPPADRPTQAGPEGIFFDFNQGCRVLLPQREHGSWRARLRDLDTGNILFESEN